SQCLVMLIERLWSRRPLVRIRYRAFPRGQQGSGLGRDGLRAKEVRRSWRLRTTLRDDRRHGHNVACSSLDPGGGLRSAAMRLIEVSHAIEPGMKTYPGLPEPRAEVLVDYESSRSKYEGKSEFLIASLHLCGNTGTYVDAPIHRHRGAADLASLPLARLAHLPFVVIDVTHAPRSGVDAAVLRGLDLDGRAVLFHTGFSRHFGTERYFRDNPFLTAGACDAL